MKKRSLRMEEISVDALTRIARIVGPSSAAAQALKDIDARRARGEQDVACYLLGGTYLVGPRVAE